MNNDIILIVIVLVVMVCIVLLHRIILKRKKKITTDKLKDMLNLTPNEFAKKFVMDKLLEYSGLNIKNSNLSKSEIKDDTNACRKYTFEIYVVLLYLAYEDSKAQHKEITIDDILNFSFLSGLGTANFTFAFGMINSFEEKIKIVLKNRFILYDNKSHSQIKNIFCNICFEEIKTNNYIIKQDISSDTMSGTPMMIEHLNKLFETDLLYANATLIYMYIYYNRKNLEVAMNKIIKNIKNPEPIEKLMYDIDRHEPSQFFIDTRKLVGTWLQQKMNQIEGTRWIKGYLTYPAFEHLSFSYKNQIFCVVVDIIDENTKKSCLPDKTKNLLIKECEKNNLIPWLYKVLVDNPQNPAYNTLKQYSDGWNLFDARNNEPIIPERLGTDDLVEMSEWELNDFAIQVVRDYITDNLKLKILSYQNIVGIDPQLWFIDDNQQKHFVLVRYTMYPNKNAKKPDNIISIQNKCKGYDGFFASVAFCSKGENPSILYRGQGAFISFEGLEKLEPAKDVSTSFFEEIAINISAEVANIFMKFNLVNYTEDERINYLYMYSMELLLEIYSSLIIESNTSVNENNLFPYLLSYLEKMTPPNHRGLIDWTNIVMSRCKLYRQMKNLDNDNYGLFFTKLCQHELNAGTIYTYESMENIPMTLYNDKFNSFYYEILKTNIINDIKNKLKNYL